MGFRATMADRMNICWKEFQATAGRTFQALQTDEAFTDVTLASGDGKQLKAHKVILSSASSFFKTILIQNPHQHTWAFLKGVEMKHIEALLNFIYSGQVEIRDEDLADFLAAAHDLKIDGLKQRDSVEEEDNTVDTIEEEDSTVDTVEEEENTADGRLMDYDTANDEEVDVKTEKRMMNDAAIKIETYMDLKCYDCEKVYSSGTNLRRHRGSVHEGKLYPCSFCDFKSTDKSYLLKHIRKTHGIEHAGKQEKERLAEDTTDENVELIIDEMKSVLEEDHILSGEAKCEQCDKLFSSKTNLKRHIISVHEKVRFTCDFCDYTLSDKSHMTRHIRKNHASEKINEDDKETLSLEFQLPLDVQISEPSDMDTSEEEPWNHRRAAHQKVTCDKCHKEVSKSNLARHIRTLHTSVELS